MRPFTIADSGGTRGEGDSIVKGSGMLVVSLRGKNQRFGIFQGVKIEIQSFSISWYLLGYQKSPSFIISCSQTEDICPTKACRPSNFVFIIIMFIACYRWYLLGVKKSSGHALLKTLPVSFRGIFENFRRAYPIVLQWSPPPPGVHAFFTQKKGSSILEYDLASSAGNSLLFLLGLPLQRLF